MREIKFRAWCTFEEKIYNQFYIDEHATFAFMHELIESAKERYNLMQYTNLKDKNGKEIYEGDILLAEYGGHNEMLSYFVVQMVDGCWGAVIYYDYPVEGDNFYWKYVNEFKEAEVVGNIYENPELIA